MLPAAQQRSRSGGRARVPATAALLVLAAGLRLASLGRPSLWYDEVVTMRLARQDGPLALLALLGEIDATRAPLQPLLLQAWLALLGPSDLAGRLFSALCGIATVPLAVRIARRLYGRRAAVLAGWLAAISPLLVLYSREVRMYAWLVLLTALAWDLLLSFRRSCPPARLAAWAGVQIALAYSHPLGLLMDGALGLAYLANRRSWRLAPARWLVLQLVVLAAVAPWIPRYLDHEPEVVNPPTLRLLLGLPIGFVGGNAPAMLACAGLVAFGLFRFGRRGAKIRLGRPLAARVLLIWFLVPPLALFACALAGRPVFGQARYTLFVGPAYLILLAHGLAKLPRVPRTIALLVISLLVGQELAGRVYAPDLKADWRAAAAFLGRQPGRPVVVLHSERPDLEASTARYYLPAAVAIRERADLPLDGRRPAWLAVGLRDGQPSPPLPDLPLGPPVEFPGLRLYPLTNDADLRSRRQATGIRCDIAARTGPESSRGKNGRDPTGASAR